MTDRGGPRLGRRVGTADAVYLGLGAMVGAGVFSALGPAAAAAGGALLLGLLVAAVVAYCNATASAQLAAQYPTSGGTYVYGRERLGSWWGFAAGWCFVIGKTASCAAMALTFAAYAVPDAGWVRRAVACGAVVALTYVATRGVTRTARLTRVLVSVTLLVLAATVAVLLIGASPSQRGPSSLVQDVVADVTLLGVLQSAGLLFFAFAGYARIATMGEEVRDPTRTIPRAVLIALAVALLVYVLVAVAALLAAGPGRLAGDTAPLATAASAVGAGWLGPLLTVGAAVASLGALLALLAGVGRTSLAMGRHRDLPGWFAAVHPRHHVPHHAQLAVGAVVAVLVLVTDLRGVIGFSSFGVLLYYAVANAAAYTQEPEHRRWPRALQVLGVVGCVTLVVTLPGASVLAGVAVLALGLLGRLLVRRGGLTTAGG